MEMDICLSTKLFEPNGSQAEDERYSSTNITNSY